MIRAAGLFWLLLWLMPTVARSACADLAALSLPDVRIQSTNDVATGEFTPAAAERAFQVRAFCRVRAVATPSPDSVIQFEVWIPAGEGWNRKLLGTGNGGFAGSISYAAMAGALARGYATVGSDTGHTGDQMEFGEGHPQKVIDWAYRAVHVTTQAAQAIVRSYTGMAPAHSYFQGCSTGGQQALSEAQRYPEDYDGIVAGAPGYDRIRLILGFLWSWSALHDSNGRPLLDASQLSLLTRKATERCDRSDGLMDELIGDPRRCRFDPAVLACTGATARDCLTPVQIAAVKKVYQGARNARTGAQLFPGWIRGSEAGWGTYLVDPTEPPRLGLFRYFAFQDRDWDWRTFDWDRDVARVEAAVPHLSAVSRDLSGFRRRGGRLLMYTGWADPVVPPASVVSYYESVARASGGFARTGEFFRFFAIPGMGHCGGGSGLNTVDPLPALEDWVEHDRTPEMLTASRIVNGKVQRTRPVCAHPGEARYAGHGSIDVAQNFACYF